MRKMFVGLLLVCAALLAWPRLLDQARILFLPADSLQDPSDGISLEMAASYNQRDLIPVTLYFRYMQTGYLVQEARELEVAPNEIVELAIVRALMDGPSAVSQDLAPLFSVNDRLMAVRLEDNDQVTVVLGERFLEPPSDAPSDWENYEYWAQEVPRRRRLAIQAVTNTLTEGGRCDAVQFLVSAGPEDVHGMRIRSAPFFGGDEDLLLPPQFRQEEAVLTPQIALGALLDAWQRKDWQTLYAFLLRYAPKGTALPSQIDFLMWIDEMELSLLYYRISVGTVSIDGSSATICLTARIMNKDGQIRELFQKPVLMMREYGCWKMSFDSLMRLMR